jgi:hypothetical protein
VVCCPYACRWGKGHCRYTDGSVYEGQWVKNQRHGTGRMTLSDGTMYEGEWQDDRLHGVGKSWGTFDLLVLQLRLMDEVSCW